MPPEASDAKDDDARREPIPERPRAWGGDNEAYGSGEEREAARARRSARAASQRSPITMGFGFVVLVFGLYTVARRRKWVEDAIDLHQRVTGSREAAAQWSELLGVPAHPMLEAMAPSDSLVAPTLTAGVLGVMAGAAFVVIGALVLLRHRLAIRPGAVGLLAAAGAFAASHAADVWIGHRVITLMEEMVHRTTRPLRAAGPLQAAMAETYEQLTAPDIPSLGDYVIEALFWAVPILLVAVWGARYLQSREVRDAFGA